MAIGALLLISATFLLTVRRRPYLLAGWCWFAVALLPVSGLVQVGMQAMADRYTYVPLVGLFVIVAWGVPDLVDAGFSRAGRPTPKAARRMLAAAGLLWIAALVPVAFTQARTWRTSRALFEHALAVSDRNDLAHAAYGSASLSLSRPACTSYQVLKRTSGSIPAFLNLSLL